MAIKVCCAPNFAITGRSVCHDAAAARPAATGLVAQAKRAHRRLRRTSHLCFHRRLFRRRMAVAAVVGAVKHRKARVSLVARVCAFRRRWRCGAVAHQDCAKKTKKMTLVAAALRRASLHDSACGAARRRMPGLVFVALGSPETASRSASASKDGSPSGGPPCMGSLTLRLLWLGLYHNYHKLIN